MKDFTFAAFEHLLIALQTQHYVFYSFEDYITKKPTGKIVILRHDVDALPYNSVQTATIENKLGIKSVYYFRIVKQSNVPDAIKRIVDLGHEVGYHYEDLTLVRGDIDKAIKKFEANLEYFRKYYPVRTICMHGSPMTKWDNKGVWAKYNYRDFGIIGEPYYDIDFKQFGYLTDTGRRWDGGKVSVRDKVSSGYDFHFHTTFDIVNSAKELPDQIMITVHPQRWNDNMARWMLEYVCQNGKNIVKRFITTP